MALELKIISPSEEGFVKQIVWNADEIAEYVAGRVGYYKNLVYTDDQIVEAKKDRAELNKFISALKAKDREIKKLCLQPYEEFHQKMQLIIAQVEEPVNLIDKQVKDYEDQQKAAKTEEIKKLFEEKGFQPWVTLDRIWNPSWLNKSYSLKKIEADLSTIQHSIGEDILPSESTSAPWTRQRLSKPARDTSKPNTRNSAWLRLSAGSGMKRPAGHRKRSTGILASRPLLWKHTLKLRSR